MATGDESVRWRRAARTGKRKTRGSVRWLWPLIAPVGVGIVAACGVSWAADPSVVSPSGLPAQVRPTYPEPGLPAFSFPTGGVTGAGSGTPGTSGTPATPATPGTPGSSPASASTMADYQQYVGSYYGANEQCVSLTRDFDSALPPSSLWQQGQQVEGATDIAPRTAIATFNFDGAYGPSDSPGGASGVSHTGIYLGQDASGVQILDQWSGSGGASIHTIPWSSWGGNTAEAGSHYYVIK